VVEYRVELDNRELADNMRRWERDTPGFTRLLLQRFSSKLVGMSQERAGDVLNVISGRLRGSIFGKVRGNDLLEFGAGSNVVYARIHEFGGTIKPKNGQFLKFPGRDGRDIFVKQVEIPARPYVRPSIETFFRDGTSDDVARGLFNEKKREYGFT
jgi:phage gpG-like protein